MRPRVNVVAVVVAAVVHFALGAAWFTLFAKAWLSGTRLSSEQIQAASFAPSPWPYILAFICNLVMAYTIALVLLLVSQEGAMAGFKLGAMLGFGIAVAAMVTEFAFELRTPAFAAITAGYPFIGCMVMGTILGAWRRFVPARPFVSTAG